jgi:hypothetical protein
MRLYGNTRTCNIIHPITSSLRRFSQNSNAEHHHVHTLISNYAQIGHTLQVRIEINLRHPRKLLHALCRFSQNSSSLKKASWAYPVTNFIHTGRKKKVENTGKISFPLLSTVICLSPYQVAQSIENSPQPFNEYGSYG